MAWAYRASSFATTSSITYNTGNTLALGHALTLGDRIVVGTMVHNASALPAAPTVSDDTNSGNYTEDAFKDVPDGSSHGRCSVFSHANSAAATPTVTVLAGHAGDDGGFSVAAYSGLLASDPGKDQSAAGTGANLSPTSGATANTGAANELALGYYADDGWGKTLNAGTNFTSRGKHDGDSTSYEGLIEDKDSGASGSAITSTETYSAGGSTVPPWGMLCVVYKLSSGTVNTKALTGGLSFVGAFTKTTLIPQTGSLSFVGAQSKKTLWVRTAALSFVGTVTKFTTMTAFTAALSFVGTHVASHTFIKALTAALSFGGSLATSFIAGVGFKLMGLPGLNSTTKIGPGKTHDDD